MNKQHVQLPHNMTKSGKLTPNDLFIYLTIKRYMNNGTRQAFPSLKTLSIKCKFSINTIRKSIKILEEEEWIEITEDGRKHIYKFSTQKGLFERFSYDFLDNNVPPREKAYLIATQQHMIKEHNIGKTSYNNRELSSKINLSEYKIKTYDNSLEEEGALVMNKSDSGLSKNIKFFQLEKLGQAILFIDKKVNLLQEGQDENNKTIQYLLKEVDSLKKQMHLKDNSDIVNL